MTVGPIAYVVGRYPAVSHTFILREVRALRERGVEVVPISIHRARPGDLLGDADRREAARTLAVLPLGLKRLVRAHLSAITRRPSGYLRGIRKAWELARPGVRGHVWALLYFLEAGVVWSHCRRHGVRHLHAHHLNQASDAALLAVKIEGADRHGRPRWAWSFTVHGPDELVDVSAFRVPEKTRSATAVACISDFARAQLTPFLPPTEWHKLHVVRCGLLVDEWPAPQPGGEVDKADHRLRILCIGRLVPVKAHGLLLEATRKLIDRGIAAHTTLIGDGPQRPELEEAIRRLGLSEAVDLLGAVSQDDLRQHFVDADAFAISSSAEGLPVVLMEAMVMGLPVVATSVAGTTELVQHGINGLVVPPGRGDLLADALELLARSPALRHTLGTQGRDTVVNGFDVRDSAAKLEKLFAEVAQR
jgi:glycosyltransferase involved in cell wall biosynthesis